ncbi:hypothetical protein IEQ34_007347 [Dendrobium chrysotoxum]|uniref:HTH myb-type domain-containing protein n=1 Tax=Dendrobium chrysotoxum TaxID=161865 RepID=A0AAV7H6N7_DENCH|nr:hypothetical protein IEQ34_007347 [Dendrobium chrysotoxum]
MLIAIHLKLIIPDDQMVIQDDLYKILLLIVQSKDQDSYGDKVEMILKVRKPYTITKQHERWTKDEHKKFLEAIQLHDRAWCCIKEHIGTKTTVQIQSHAHKFVYKL